MTDIQPSVNIDIATSVDEKWLEELRTAPPAAVRGYFHAIVKMGKFVWLYGILGMSVRMNSSPADIVGLLEDRQPVAQIAKERNISLEGTDQITEEEHNAYEESYQRVYNDVVKRYIEDQDIEHLALLDNLPLEA